MKLCPSCFWNLEQIPCDICGNGEKHSFHGSASECEGCQAPEDHHKYKPSSSVQLEEVYVEISEE